MDFADGMLGDTCDDGTKIGFGVDCVDLGGFEEG
jgi:hypothetical protein